MVPYFGFQNFSHCTRLVPFLLLNFGPFLKLYHFCLWFLVLFSNGTIFFAEFSHIPQLVPYLLQHFHTFLKWYQFCFIFSALCSNRGGGGGIRYQVPDFTLVGGSFFLPKTQLVHGTNWWVYCPFSRKTVSTWY